MVDVSDEQFVLSIKRDIYSRINSVCEGYHYYKKEKEKEYIVPANDITFCVMLRDIATTLHTKSSTNHEDSTELLNLCHTLNRVIKYNSSYKEDVCPVCNLDARKTTSIGTTLALLLLAVAYIFIVKYRR